MIDAKTAREGTKSIRSNTIRFVLDSVSVQIENAMKAGRYGVAVDGKIVPQHLHSEFKQTVQQLGYEIEHFTGCQRDPADQWNISWHKDAPGASKLG